ncbi:MAG: hypothetical protein EWM73_00220 [Nitrospira sp.]|nr:MAG: hypothetical protein EWM73_00220 [Nitrospira sp.]
MPRIRIIDKLVKVLRNRPTVITRAFFWSIPHNSGKQDICLKIGRYKKPQEVPAAEVPESLQPKSELTLDDEEFKALIEFLQEQYEPFRQGVKAFIPLDKPYEKENAAQIRALFALPDKQKLVRFILNHDVIPEDLAAGLQQAHRNRAIKQFESMLEQDEKEPAWQEWFEKNSCGLQFWAASLDHGNYVPSTDLTKAITQASRYIYEVEREANSVKFLERVGQVKTVKPRCILIFGRSNKWDNRQIEAYRILNAGFHNITIMTYDHVLGRAKRIVGVNSMQIEGQA